MTALPVATLTLVYNGRDVASEFDPHVIDFTYTDHLHGKADEIAVKLRDDTGLWRGPWRPEKGDLVEAAIAFEGRTMPCGLFKIDIPTAGGSRSGDTLSFRAVSAFYSEKLRTQNTRQFENIKLSEIAETIAAKHGLEVIGEIDDIRFTRKTQRRKRDLQFLRELAEDYGHFFTVKGRQLVMVKRETMERAGAVRTVELADLTTITNWTAKDQAHGVYAEARVQHLHTKEKRLIEARATDPNVSGGDVLNIDARVENDEQAERIAKGRLAKTNEDARTAGLTLIGDPALVAGIVIQLGPTFGRYTGLYLAHQSTHKQARGGYTVGLDLKGVAE